ncbi:MAG: hypothetical protein J6S14_12525 [Clostridia bacterium]|nr:hypothetical protein [Clostridia bacterium]
MKITIENYENLTTEEKLAAWEAYDPEKNGFVSKATFDKKASEASELGKQLRAKQTDEEAKATKEAEERAALEARVKELETERAVNGYEKAYLAMGYDEKTAKSSAEAMARGDMDTVFANQKTHIENREKALKAELLKETPAPAGGNQPTGMKKEDFKKMSLAEKQKFATENPEIYASFYNKQEE